MCDRKKYLRPGVSAPDDRHDCRLPFGGCKTGNGRRFFSRPQIKRILFSADKVILKSAYLNRIVHMPNVRATLDTFARPTGRSIVLSANGGYSLFGRYGTIGGTAILILLALRLVYFFHLRKYFDHATGQPYSDLAWSDQRKQKRYLAQMHDQVIRRHWWEAYERSKSIDRSIDAYSDHPRLRAEFLLPIDQLGQQARQDFDGAGAAAVRNAMGQFTNLRFSHPVAAYNAVKAVQQQAETLAEEDPAGQFILEKFNDTLSMATNIRNIALVDRQRVAQMKARQLRNQRQSSPIFASGPAIFHPVYHPPMMSPPAQSDIFHPAPFRTVPPTANSPAPQPQGPPPPPPLSPADQSLLALRSNPVYLGANRRATEIVNTLSRQIDNARTPWRGMSDRTHAAAELLGIYVNLRGLAANVPMNVKIDDDLRQLNGHLAVQDNPIEGSILGIRSLRNILAVWAGQRAKRSRSFAARYQALGAVGKWKPLSPAPIPQIQADYATANRRVLALFKLDFDGGRAGGVAAVAGPALLKPQAAAATAAQRKAMAAQRKMLQVLLAALTRKDNAMAQTIADKLNGALPTETSAIVVQEDYLQGIVWCLQYLIRDL